MSTFNSNLNNSVPMEYENPYINGICPSFFVFKYDKELNIRYSNSNCQKYISLNPGSKLTREELAAINGASEDYFISFDKFNPIRYTQSRINITGSHLFLHWINIASVIQEEEIREVTSIGVDLSNLSLLEQRLNNAERKSEIFFDCVEIPIIIKNMEGKIVDVNNEACQILGYKKEDLVSLNYSDIMANMHPEFIEKIREELSRKNNFEYASEIVRKDGTILFMHCKCRAVNIGGKDMILTIAHDMTEKRKKDEEDKRKHMKYDINEGNIYLVNFIERETAIDAFNNLLSCGYSGVVISSKNEGDFKKTIDKFKFYWISNYEKNGCLKPNYRSIDLGLGDISRKSVVLIDDIEYLEINSDYIQTLLFIKSLKELAQIKCSVFILCVDMNLVEGKIKYVIEKETYRIVKKSEEFISFNMERILKYVNERNINGVKPSHTDICKALKITRPTVKRNITILLSRKYLFTNMEGRSKRLEITDKGKKELENRIC